MKRRGFLLMMAAVVVIAISLIVVTIMAKNELDSIKDLYADLDEKRPVHSTVEKSTTHEAHTTKEEETTKRRQIQKQFEKFVFVGDSRFKGMSYMAEENDVFICESGRGYDFLLEQMSNIAYECDENTALIIGLGVNDNMYNFEKYIETLNDMAETMDCQIYYMLVNPVDEAAEEYNGYNVKNENIEFFNENIQLGLDEEIGIIDTNSYLKEVGFETQDGLHYTNETYEKIYSFIKGEIIG